MSNPLTITKQDLNNHFGEGFVKEETPPTYGNPTIKQNILRVGRFTSSPIVKLTKVAKDGKSFGKPALEYIAEKNMERRLLRSLNDESNARPLSWGKLVEKRVFELLGTEYQDNFDKTIQHHSINFWVGSPDANKFTDGKTISDTVVEIKCPLTLKSFCQLADCKSIEEVRASHDKGEDYYWQIVSNAILTGSKYAELIVYLPYQSELETIRELAHDNSGDQNKIAWIGFANDDDLPFLIDGGYYKNLNKISFEVPQSDKDLLTAKVIEAGKQLIPFHK